MCAEGGWEIRDYETEKNGIGDEQAYVPGAELCSPISSRRCPGTESERVDLVARLRRATPPGDMDLRKIWT